LQKELAESSVRCPASCATRPARVARADEKAKPLSRGVRRRTSLRSTPDRFEAGTGSLLCLAAR